MIDIFLLIYCISRPINVTVLLKYLELFCTVLYLCCTVLKIRLCSSEVSICHVLAPHHTLLASHRRNYRLIQCVYFSLWIFQLPPPFGNPVDFKTQVVIRFLVLKVWKKLILIARSVKCMYKILWTMEWMYARRAFKPDSQATVF